MKREVITERDYSLAAAWCARLLEKEEISPEETEMLIAFGKDALRGWARWFNEVAAANGFLFDSKEWAIWLVMDTIQDGTDRGA